MTHTLPSLTFPYDSLEPHFDKETMVIHHTQHHQTYIEKLNSALTKAPEFADLDVTSLLKKFDEIPSEIQPAIRNHGGGHANHSLFWQILCPQFDQLPSGDLATSIQSTFTSFGDFQAKFTDTALNHFGSGWAWLVVDKDKNLSIISTTNQDSPLLSNLNPILGLDVWEHAYYLKYQNKRADYISSFWHIINWDAVAKLYTEALNAKEEVAPHH